MNVSFVARWLIASAFLFASTMQASLAPHAGVFYVADYSASGQHTDYDMARQAADAYTTTSYIKGSVLILKTGMNETCDAVPLPTLANNITTSIMGAGSAASTLIKKAGCAASKATLSHNDVANGALSRGLYQGFTVDANHIDSAACEFYGMTDTTMMDVSCGNAIAGADHELDMGNRDANSTGWMDNIYLYSLTTFDSVQGGSGAALAPVWSFGALSSVTLINPGTTAYTPQYVRAQVFGPDIITCSRVPTLVPSLDASHHVTGAIVTNGGSCTSTSHLYILIQDGTPVTYSMKFTNMADSHAWNLRATNTATYGISWLQGCNNNSIYQEEAGPNQIFGIFDNGNGNKHVDYTVADALGYAVEINSQNGSFVNGTLSFNANNAFPATSGFYLGNDHRVYQDWAINGTQCSGVASANFLPITTQRGVLSTSWPVPSGAKPENVEACDGTSYIHWATIQ